MSTVESTVRFLEKASDWMNPILVKETRQALKSRQFVVTFMLLLVASWLITLFLSLLAGDAIEYGSMGREFFAFYFFVLSVAIFVIVPFGAYRSLLNERDLNTYELLSITTLRPRQIVWGKLFSSLVQVFIYYSAIAPFIAFTSLLQGFDLVQVSFVLVVSLLVSLAASMVALMLSTMARQRHWQALNSLAVLGGLLFVLFASWGVFTQLMMWAPFDEPDFWWGIGFMVLFGTTFLVLFQQITTAQLTFDSDNRSTGIRVTCSLQFLLMWTCVIGYELYHSGGISLGREDIQGFTVLSVLFWSIAGLFFTTEEDYLSRRIRRDMPRSRLLRLLISPLMPGGGRGMLLVAIHLALTFVFAFELEMLNSGTIHSAAYFVGAACCYVFIYLGLGAAVGRGARRISSEIRAPHARVLTLLVVAGGIIAPYLSQFSSSMRNLNSYSLVYISDPNSTLSELSRESYSGFQESILMILIVVAALTLMVNARPMLRGIADVVTAQAPPRAAAESSHRNEQSAVGGPSAVDGGLGMENV